MKLFDSIRLKRPPKSKFDLSHEKKLTLDFAALVPIMCQEILPGDSFRVNSEILLRFAPLISPVMHRINVFTHYFFVPNRLIWNEWEKFITGGPQGTDAPLMPYFNYPQSGWDDSYSAPGSLSDYLGLPTKPAGTVPTQTYQVSALPYRAYQLIFDEYYRDQTLTPAVNFDKGSGPIQIPGDDVKLLTLRKRAWQKDYFTAALPFSQRGPEVNIPGTTTPLKPAAAFKNSDDTPATGALSANASAVLAGADPVYLDTVQEVGININDLRASARLQEWLEKNARGGARYVEQLLSHWGIMPEDARLQRPEFLSGNRQPVVISEVLSNFQFSGDAEGLPQGNMAGHAISVGGTNGFKRKFTEHGYVICIMSILPTTSYSQGIPKQFSRFDKLEYAWPEFAQLGEQPIENKELYVGDFTSAQPVGPFGYTPRYAEYKYGISTIHGNMRDSLEYWHMARKFASQPALNEAFVTADPTKRIFAVTDPNVHNLYCNIYHNVSAIRPLPYFGTPTL